MNTCVPLEIADFVTKQRAWAQYILDKIQGKIAKFHIKNYREPTHICLNVTDMIVIKHMYSNHYVSLQLGGQLQFMGLTIISSTDLVEGEVLILGE